MSATQTAARLVEFAGRGAGTNAERRAALWLRGEAEFRQREATIETFWCRPNWAMAHSWHVALAIAGSLVMVSDAALGGALVLVAILCILADWLTGRSPGRRLTPERASQNVVSEPPRATPPAANLPPAGGQRLRLIITANYDAGRTGLVDHPRLRALGRRLAGHGRFTPGWLGWLVIAQLWLLIVAIVRHANSTATTSSAVGVLQLIPTVVLVLALAMLLEAALADFGPSAADNAAGTAVALALTRALDVAPPRRLDVELVLQGAGDRQMIGLVRHLRGRRNLLTATNTIVLGIGPVAAGQPHWWTSDGSLVPLGYDRWLRGVAQELAGPETWLDARPHRGRGTAPALPARMLRIPAINLGSLDARELAPGSHTAQDTAENLDLQAADGLLQFALVLVDAIDSDLVRQDPRGRDPTSPAPTAAHL